MSDRWQYEIIEVKAKLWGNFDLAQAMTEFDRMGRQGWEMVSFTPPLAGMTAGFAVFKKRGA
ncbi:DUF4177 domain-containing protein [Solilutibacter tolerans]|uniref:DUF4177 domain-containing protein n=1 Tax=Solilutibacter tolerans TaxID=1604334 RepID=A0A1N6PIL8_9GAMM|nr:DUF4177 domain-containing protein [Lysobacter tolerans]SIQ04200.1 protein of unknown function [Lysobacter tolerans]